MGAHPLEPQLPVCRLSLPPVGRHEVAVLLLEVYQLIDDGAVTALPEGVLHGLLHLLQFLPEDRREEELVDDTPDHPVDLLLEVAEGSLPVAR